MTWNIPRKRKLDAKEAENLDFCRTKRPKPWLLHHRKVPDVDAWEISHCKRGMFYIICINSAFATIRKRLVHFMYRNKMYLCQ